MSEKAFRCIPGPEGSTFSQCTIAGNYVFVAGQAPRDPATGRIPDGVEAQTEQILKNISDILEQAGSSLQKVVKVSVFLSDIALYDGFSRAFSRYFAPPYPARTTVGAQLAGFLVEIEAIAAL